MKTSGIFLEAARSATRTYGMRLGQSLVYILPISKEMHKHYLENIEGTDRDFYYCSNDVTVLNKFYLYWVPILDKEIVAK